MKIVSWNSFVKSRECNNKRVSVAISHSWRTTLREMAKNQGTTVNKLILEAINEKYKFNF